MTKIDEDIALARRLCKELQSGNKEILASVYNTYHKDFLKFAKYRLYESVMYKPDDVLMNFWEDIVKGDIFCRYSSRSSLKNYLKNSLYNKIIDLNRIIVRERKRVEKSDKLDELPIMLHDKPDKKL